MHTFASKIFLVGLVIFGSSCVHYIKPIHANWVQLCIEQGGTPDITPMEPLDITVSYTCKFPEELVTETFQGKIL